MKRAWACTAAAATALFTAGCGSAPPDLHADASVRIPCAVHEGDLDFHALFTACQYARERFRVLLDREPYPVTIIVHDTTVAYNNLRDGRAFYYHPSNGALARAHSVFAGPRSPDPTFLVDHEIGHILLFAATSGGVGPPPGEYGTVLPDWFDEGVAIWAEDEEQRVARMRSAAALPDAALDLLAFASLRHPGWASAPFQRSESVTHVIHPCRTAVCPPNPVGRDTFMVRHLINGAGVVSVDTLFPEDAAFHTSNTDGYYAIASTVLPFFHRHGGPRLINILLERMSRGDDPRQVFSGLPGLPAEPEEVNAAWVRFVRSFANDSSR